MPHFILDCSTTLTDQIPPQKLLHTVNQLAIDSELFAPEDIKVRIRQSEHCLVGGSKKDFIHVFAYIMQGRTEAQKAALSRSIVAHIKGLLPEVPIVSMNVMDFEKATYANRNMV